MLLGHQQEAITLAQAIKEEKHTRQLDLDEIVRKMVIRFRLAHCPLTEITVRDKLKRLERGDLYFGNTSLHAQRGIRGHENLNRLALYLFYLGIGENDPLIERLKKFDSRFQYSKEYLEKVYPLREL